VQVRRLAVPVVAPTESGRPLDRAAVKAEMEDVRSRALAGEDLNQLQLDAYKHLQIQATPPPLNVISLQRRTVQGDEAKAFDMKPGELTAVLDLAAAFVVMKVESKDAIPIESVRPEIDAALRHAHVQNEVGKLSKQVSAQFNLEYLGMPSQPDLFGATTITPVTSRASAPRAAGTR